MKMKPVAVTALLLAALALAPPMRAQSVPLVGPVGPSLYDVVRGWQKPWITHLKPLRFVKLDSRG